MTADKYRDLGGPTSPTTIVLAELPAIGQLACAGGDHDAVGQAMRYTLDALGRDGERDDGPGVG
jgi:hypothetical protein